MVGRRQRHDLQNGSVWLQSGSYRQLQLLTLFKVGSATVEKLTVQLCSDSNSSGAAGRERRPSDEAGAGAAMREGWRQSARPAAQRAAAALRALETDTIEGRSQRAYESSDPKKEELRGRSMRVRTPTWRALGEPERDPSPYRMSEKSLRASSLR